MTRVQKTALYCAIACLSGAALFAIGVVLFGSFDDFEAAVLLTAMIIGGVSVCILASAAYRHPIVGPKIGYVGIAIQLLAAALLIGAVWAELGVPSYKRNVPMEFWQTTWVLVTIGIAFAHVLGLLTAKIPPGQKWIQYVATVVIFLLAGIICFVILNIDGGLPEEFLFKSIAVLSILAALATLVIPILHFIAKSPRRKQGVLILAPCGDGTFEGPGGRKFTVQEVLPADVG